jgi:hypothetical protein
MKPSLYTFKIDERNGEKEYSYYEYLYATSQEEAEKIARGWAKTFYSDSTVEGKDCWSTEFGGIEWCLESVAPCKAVAIRPINGDSFLLPIPYA